MIPLTLFAVSFFGLGGLFALKIYELKNRVRLFSAMRTRLDMWIETTSAQVHERLAVLQASVTPVRIVLVVFGAFASSLLVLVAFLEYIRAQVDRVTRYVAVHYGDARTTQSVFLKEISAHKETMQKVRKPRRTKKVDNTLEVV